MAFEDLPLSRTPSWEPPVPPRVPPGGGSPTRWIGVAALALVAGGGLGFWWMTRSQPEQVPPPPPEATEGAVKSSRPQRQPWELPALDGSDAIFREAVATLSKHPMLARLLATDGLIRAAVLAVVQIGDGKTPVVPLAVLRPTTRLTIVGDPQGRLDSASYPRWSGPTNALVSVSPSDAAQLYVNVKDLFDAAYADLGHPGGNFDEAITRAIEVVVATPVATDPPLLWRRPGYFEHTDAALRSLRPVQKQLMLTGPENQQRLVTWLRELAAKLDLKIR
ncbi:MAG TPA: DUF3014 domain-containing protein [Vicinamibacterales bacterium]|nr:DUF3014 domain-containing protein [Vicinamibacterales bacterium]